MNNQPIVWGSKEITWDDFITASYVEDNYSVIIQTGVSYPKQLPDGHLNIYAYMETNGSIKEKGIKLTSNLLSHEQYHFNITEYFARLIRKNVVSVGEDNLTSERLRSICEAYKEDRIDYQNKYDIYTNHGLSKQNQLLWEKEIDSLLNNLENYSNPNIYDYEDFVY